MLHSLERVPRALWITAAAAVASAVGTTGSTSHGSETALARGVSRVALARCAPACEQAASDSARPYRGSDSGAGSWHKPAATAAAPAPAGWSPLRTPIAPRTSRTYTSEEVAEHDGSAAAGGSLWVTVGDGVYDVTSFQHEHPGGADFIRQAGGSSVAGFWAHWAYHYHSPKVPRFLSKLRIGTLRDHDGSEDVASLGLESEAVRDMYAGDPPADRRQEVLVDAPRNTQTARWAMASSHLTPNDAFYVRNHAPVPDSEGDDHSVTFQAFVPFLPSNSAQPPPQARVSLAELKSRGRRARVTSVMQCCGNRAKEMIAQSGRTAFSDTPYEVIDVGMMGNAVWQGVRLAEVLEDLFPWLADISSEQRSRLHVHFHGKDQYSTSTPLARVVDPTCDVLLATHMNGEALPPHHGAPVRVVIPGVGGARNVKWVNRIEIHDHASPSCWTQTYYKDTSRASSDPPPIQLLPLQSLVLSVASGQAVSLTSDCVDAGAATAHGDGSAATAARCLPLLGIAWGGGSGSGVSSVEVSADGGKSWHAAKLLDSERLPDDTSSGRDWGWVRWQAVVPLPEDAAAGSSVTVVCRAVDGAGTQQPQTTFMPGGYLFGGWHTTTVTLTK